MKTYTYELIGYKIASNSGLILRFKSTDAAQEVRKSIIDSIASYYGGNDDSFENIEHMYTNTNDFTIYFKSWDSRENFIRRHIKHENQKIYYMTVASSPYLELNRADSFTCTIDDINEDVRKMLMNEPYTFKPKTDDVKLAMNSLYGVKSMKKLGDVKSIHISTEGYEAPLSWAGVNYKPIFSLYKTMYCDNEPFTFEYKEDKNLDRVIRHVQVNEKKKVVTIVWKDGEVTMAKCGPNDMWDPEKGVLVCVAKRFFNSGTQFNKWLKSVIPEPEEETKSLLDNIVEGIKNNYQPKHSATE